MNNEFEKLEQELKDLKPRRMSLSARQSIEQKLAEPARLIIYPRITGIVSAAAAIFIALGIIILQPDVQDKQKKELVAVPKNLTEDIFKPVKVNTVLLDKQEEALVQVKGDAPMRRIKYRLVDNMEWYNPERKTTFSATVPREQIVLVSTAMN